MTAQNRAVAGAEAYSLEKVLPDLSFELTSGLNGDAVIVDDRLRSMAGVAVGLASEQIPPRTLRYLYDRDLGLRVMAVPKQYVGVGHPIQTQLAEAELGFYARGTTLTLTGSLRGQPTSSAQFVRIGPPRGPGVWRPERVYGQGEGGDYKSVRVSPFELDADKRGAGYERLISVAQNLGAVADAAAGLVESGEFAVQIELIGFTTESPSVPDADLDGFRQSQAAFREHLLSTRPTS